ncbi:MAG: HlyD family efflux transporter periplasmic adaptor subunit [Rhodospirillaceae bacterium]
MIPADGRHLTQFPGAAQSGERHIKDATQELQDVNEGLSEVAEKVRAARDILARAQVTAPTDGVVVQLRVHTPGGVVQAGEPLLDLVPQNDLRVVELKIDPRDIDVVYPGMPARVRLTAFDARTAPMIESAVTQVSADRIVDPVTGVAYFSGRVLPMELPDREDPEKPAHPALTSRMLAEVSLVTGARTVLNYVLDPLVRTMERAGREL